MLESFILFLASWGHIVMIACIVMVILMRSITYREYSVSKRIREFFITLLYFALLAMSAYVVVLVLKWAFPVARPFVEMGLVPLLSVPMFDSFPSGHAFVLAAIAFGAYTFSRQLTVVLAIVSIFVALCRVYLSLHSGLDIIVGYVLGAIFGYLFSVKFLHIDVLEDVWKRLR